MYKLTVVAGPNRGSSFAIQEGSETTIGRQGDNVIVLPSARVSKRHCSLSVHEEEVMVQDQGSANGTFVNGVLAKSKRIKPGDRISVGEYVLELSKPSASRKAPAVAGFGNVIFDRPAGGFGSTGTPGISSAAALAPDPFSAAEPPRDLKGKLAWAIETQLMPMFYSMNLKYEWRQMLMILAGVFVLGNVFISVYPLMESSRITVVRETGARASFMAKQIVTQNVQLFTSGASSKSEVGIAADAQAVRMALLIDLDSRVIAPSTQSGQYLTNGVEAKFAVLAQKAYRAGREAGIIEELDSRTVGAIEPLKIFDPKSGRNVVVAMALVSIDTSLVTPDMGEMGMVYAQTLIFTGLLALLIGFIIYRVTLRPYRVLIEDLDRGLKGEMPQVTHEYKLEETAPLWELVDSALQRIPKGGTMDAGVGEGAISTELFAGPMRMFGETGKFGVVFCDNDRKIAYMNSVFEEISGLRLDSTIGQTIASVARDQAFAEFASDLLERVSNGGGGTVTDSFDFEGISYTVHAAGFATPGGLVKGSVMLFVKVEA